jgi:hypothetical protein
LPTDLHGLRELCVPVGLFRKLKFSRQGSGGMQGASFFEIEFLDSLSGFLRREIGICRCFDKIRGNFASSGAIYDFNLPNGRKKRFLAGTLFFKNHE